MPKIKIADIGYEAKYHPRVSQEVHWLSAVRCEEAILAGLKLPPIVLVKAEAKPYKYLVLDGRIRMDGHVRAGLESIDANIERLPRSKWLQRATELNIAHGYNMNVQDRMSVTKRLQEEGLSTAEIAGLLHMRVETLEKMVVERVYKITPEVYKSIPGGRGAEKVGEAYYGYVKAPLIDTTTEETAEESLSLQGPLSTQSVVEVLDQTIAVLRHGIDRKDKLLAGKVAEIHELSSPSASKRRRAV